MRQVIDGASVPAADGPPLFGRPYAGLLTLRDCAFVEVSSLDLQNARACNGSNVVIDPEGDWFPERGVCGSGVVVLEGSDVAVRNVSVQRVWGWGWGATGQRLTLADSRFADLQLCNANRSGDCQRVLHGGVPHPGAGWGQGLATGVRGRACAPAPGAAPGAARVPCPLSSDITIENNVVERSWGEAVDLLLSERVVVRGNNIVNAYSVGVYLDNARHAAVAGNRFVASDPAFFRTYGGGQAAAGYHGMGCVGVGTELWYPQLIDVVNVTVTANLCVGAGKGVDGYAMGDAHVDGSGLRVEGNTLVNISLVALDLPSTRGLARGNRLRNNVLGLAPGALAAAEVAAADLASWTVASNLWAGVAAVPAGLGDTAAPAPPARPSAAAATLDRAQLFGGGGSACNGPAAAMPTEPACYRPRRGGPLAGGGAAISEDEIALVRTGFFGKSRRPAAPSIGFAEPSAAAVGVGVGGAPTCNVTDGVDFVGDDLLDAAGKCAPQPCPSAAACCAMCAAKDPASEPLGACAAWSFNSGSRTCWMKSGTGKVTPRATDTSGVVVAVA
eukprot:g7190.t1